MRFDDFDTQVTCEEFYTDPEWPDEDLPYNEGDLWPDLEEEPEMDDESLEDSDEFALTSTQYALLAEMDFMRDFI